MSESENSQQGAGIGTQALVCAWPESRREDAVKGAEDEFVLCGCPRRPRAEGAGRPPLYCEQHDDPVAASKRRAKLRKDAGQPGYAAAESPRPITASADRNAQLKELTLPQQLAALQATLSELLVNTATERDEGSLLIEVETIRSDAQIAIAEAEQRAARAEQRVQAAHGERDTARAEAETARIELEAESDATAAAITAMEQAENERAQALAEAEAIKQAAEEEIRAAREQASAEVETAQAEASAAIAQAKADAQTQIEAVKAEADRQVQAAIATAEAKVAEVTAAADRRVLDAENLATQAQAEKVTAVRKAETAATLAEERATNAKNTLADVRKDYEHRLELAEKRVEQLTDDVRAEKETARTERTEQLRLTARIDQLQDALAEVRAALAAAKTAQPPTSKAK
jgi:hypothetical protein